MNSALEDFGTNALIEELWARRDLGLAVATFYRKRKMISEVCADLTNLGVPYETLEPILALVKEPRDADT